MWTPLWCEIRVSEAGRELMRKAQTNFLFDHALVSEPKAPSYFRSFLWITDASDSILWGKAYTLTDRFRLAVR
jgi:hypothetical protein